MEEDRVGRDSFFPSFNTFSMLRTEVPFVLLSCFFLSISLSLLEGAFSHFPSVVQFMGKAHAERESRQSNLAGSKT